VSTIIPALSSHTGSIQPGDSLRVIGEAIVSISGLGTFSVPPGGEQLFGPYQGGAYYRVDAIGQVHIAIAPDARVTRQAGMSLLSLNFGPSGLTIGPATSETFIAPEVRIPAGTLRVGDVIRERALIDFTGTISASDRGVICRASANAGVSIAAPILAHVATSSSSVQMIVCDRQIVLVNPTQRRSPPNWVTGPATPNIQSQLVTLPNVLNDIYLRVSANNGMTAGSMVIYYYSLWLERL